MSAQRAPVRAKRSLGYHWQLANSRCGLDRFDELIQVPEGFQDDHVGIGKCFDLLAQGGVPFLAVGPAALLDGNGW